MNKTYILAGASSATAAPLANLFRESGNRTTALTGKILTVNLPGSVLGADGFVDLCKAGSMDCGGLDA